MRGQRYRIGRIVSKSSPGCEVVVAAAGYSAYRDRPNTVIVTTRRAVTLNGVQVKASAFTKLIAFLLLVSSSVFADTTDIREWLVPWPKTSPGNVYVESGNRVWFISERGNYVANL